MPNAIRNIEVSNIEHRAILEIWWFIFYISLALGFLAKGPIAWTPLLTVALDNYLHARLAAWLGRFKFVRGIVLMLAIVAVWGIPALIQTHGEFFASRNRTTRHRPLVCDNGRSRRELLRHVPATIAVLFCHRILSFFPWSIKLPWLRKHCGANGTTSTDLSALRHRDHFHHLYSRQHEATALHAARVSVPCAFACAPLAGSGRLSRAPNAFGLQTAAPYSERSPSQLRVCGSHLRSLVPPMVARFFPAYQLFQVSRASLQPNMQFAAVEFQEPSLVWYFRSRVKGFLTPLNKRRAAEFMSAPGPRFIVLPTPVAGRNFREPAASLAILYGQRFQHRERQTRRSHAGV